MSLSFDYTGHDEGPSGEITRRIIALTDEMCSKENTEYVLRGMQENARQSLWNGSTPLFGYKAIAVKKRGDKTQKKSVIDLKTAEIVS